MGRHRLAPVAERDKRIPVMAEMYRAGQTLNQIGEKYGISRERVRQLLYGVISANEGGRAVTAAEKEKQRIANLDKRSLRIRGLTHAEYKALPKRAIRAYANQRRAARFRGIEWKFNLATWWRVWDVSGKWEERGRGYGYVMARKGDSGPYAPDNVYICTQAQNASDQYIWKPWYSDARRAHPNHNLVEFNGCRLPISVWARKKGIALGTLCERLRRGWSIERALNEPIHINKGHARRLQSEVRA